MTIAEKIILQSSSMAGAQASGICHDQLIIGWRDQFLQAGILLFTDRSALYCRDNQCLSLRQIDRNLHDKLNTLSIPIKSSFVDV